MSDLNNFSPKNNSSPYHILSIDDMSTLLISRIWEIASQQKNTPNESLKGKIITNLFYEPSTRTSSSFYSAMVIQSGSVIPINKVKFSSVTKGEDLEDTIRTVGCYSDAIYLRHSETGSANRADAVSIKPIINAGDGHGEHPTQTLLDGFTIWKYCKKLSGLNITMIGDLKNGRTVKSLTKLLSRYGTNQFNFVSPKKLKFPKKEMPKNIKYLETSKLEDVIKETDVLYVTRVQKERGSKGKYSLTKKEINLLPQNAIVMHPLPRISEIPKWFDVDPRAKYFHQMEYGLWCRMALLRQVINGHL